MKKICVYILVLFSFLVLPIPLSPQAEEIIQETDDNDVASQSEDSSKGQYKISIGDKLNIQVYEEPDLSGEFEVREDSAISYPLLGMVKVAGLTKIEAQKKLSRLLKKDYLVNPYVNVSMQEYHDRFILILGHVAKPGSYPFPKDKGLTLLQAITLAGGFTRYASIGGTKIIRMSSEGSKNTINPKVNEIIAGRKQDVPLQADDLILVPERIF